MLSLGAQGSLVKMVTLFGQSLTSKEKGGRDSTAWGQTDQLRERSGQTGWLKEAAACR